MTDGLRFGYGQTVGLMGGSFDPAHAGHVHTAVVARKRLGLDHVVWLVSPQNPLKVASSPLSQRLASARALAPRRDQVSDFESRHHCHYSIETIKALKARYKGVNFVFIMGSDVFADLHKWRAWREVMHLVPMAIVSRPPHVIKARTSRPALQFRSYQSQAHSALALARSKPPAWIMLDAPLNRDSSTQIRQSLSI